MKPPNIIQNLPGPAAQLAGRLPFLHFIGALPALPGLGKHHFTSVDAGALR
jgi:hypothetical protein